jgi:hypothetical protein
VDARDDLRCQSAAWVTVLIGYELPLRERRANARGRVAESISESQLTVAHQQV